MSADRGYDYAQGDRAGGRRALAIAGALAVTVAGSGVGAWQLLKGAGAPKHKQVQQISVVQPKELPKPPPEPEKPKEEIKEKIDTPPPEAKDESPPPEAAPRLTGDAAPGGTLDLGAGGKGKETNVIGPTGGSGTGRGYGFYTSELKNELQTLLNRKDKLRGSEYSAVVELWLSPDGRIEKVEIPGSSGDPQLNARLREAIAERDRFKAPPENMPQPVKLRITARGAG
jgi:TonB family protein